MLFVFPVAVETIKSQGQTDTSFQRLRGSILNLKSCIHALAHVYSRTQHITTRTASTRRPSYKLYKRKTRHLYISGITMVLFVINNYRIRYIKDVVIGGSCDIDQL